MEYQALRIVVQWRTHAPLALRRVKVQSILSDKLTKEAATIKANEQDFH